MNVVVPTGKIFDRDSAEFRSVLAALRDEAVERDARGLHFYDHIKRLKALGIAAARVPRSLGGSGISLSELLALVYDIGKADPNVAHVLRNHALFVESLVKPDLQEQNRDLIRRVVAGELFGASHSEDTTIAAGTPSFTVSLTPDGDRFRLNGDKVYSTGNIYMDTLVVMASRPDGKTIIAVVPAGRAGVEHLDDWDGIGQRLSGSGTTRYRNVLVEADEVLDRPGATRVRPYGSALAQLWLTTIIAAILERAVEDATAIVHGRKRNYYHGLAPEPRNDALVQQTLGSLAARAYVAETVVRDAAAALERAWISGHGVDIDFDLARDASLAALKAKIIVDELAQRVTSELFEIGGASGTSRSKGLDRHWRNIRTLASHNPGSYKARVLGDYLLNGTQPPNASFF